MPHIFFRETVFGRVGIREDAGAITHLFLPGCEKLTDAHRAEAEKETPVLRDAFRQLEKYFAGKLREFTLPLAPHGTPFQQAVWAELQKIPFGQTATYGEIARRVGNPQASRAVGMANNRNPIAIFIPCHRVVGASGKLVGYAGGIDKKQWLLTLEGCGE